METTVYKYAIWAKQFTQRMTRESQIIINITFCSLLETYLRYVFDAFLY